MSSELWLRHILKQLNHIAKDCFRVYAKATQSNPNFTAKSVSRTSNSKSFCFKEQLEMQYKSANYQLMKEPFQSKSEDCRKIVFLIFMIFMALLLCYSTSAISILRPCSKFWKIGNSCLLNPGIIIGNSSLLTPRIKIENPCLLNPWKYNRKLMSFETWNQSRKPMSLEPWNYRNSCLLNPGTIMEKLYLLNFGIIIGNSYLVNPGNTAESLSSEIWTDVSLSSN